MDQPPRFDPQTGMPIQPGSQPGYQPGLQPGVQPGGYIPPPGPPGPPKKSPLVPILLGCAGLVVLVVIGGIAMTVLGVFAFGHAVKQAADTTGAAQSIVQSAEQAAKDAEKQSGDTNGGSPSPDQAAAEGVAVLKSLVGGNKSHVTPLTRDQLKAFLPSTVDGLAENGTPSSSTGTVAGITGTSATANYGTSSPTIQVEITDAANMSGLTTIMDLLMGVANTEDDNGYEKTVDLGDTKVHEKWVTADKHAELIGIIGGRFAVTVESNGAEMSAAEQAFQSVDASKLEAAAK